MVKKIVWTNENQDVKLEQQVGVSCLTKSWLNKLAGNVQRSLCTNLMNVCFYRY